LTSSCRRHEMDPQLYFMQLLMNLPSWPVNDIDAWLPDRWKQAHEARRRVSTSLRPVFMEFSEYFHLS
jgi:hypothetical protein